MSRQRFLALCTYGGHDATAALVVARSMAAPAATAANPANSEALSMVGKRVFAVAGLSSFHQLNSWKKGALRQTETLRRTMNPPPHLIFIVADDLGTFDVPFTGSGSEIITPALSQLADRGLVLDHYYVQPLCTPTRAALLTGRHPVQVGLQHGVIRDAVPDALPVNETTLPKLLSAAGYRTVALGKWHLGFMQPQYTPERRGFDTVIGYYTG